MRDSRIVPTVLHMSSLKTFANFDSGSYMRSFCGKAFIHPEGWCAHPCTPRGFEQAHVFQLDWNVGMNIDPPFPARSRWLVLYPFHIAKNKKLGKAMLF